jgi:four helix bundle protein
VTYKSFEDLPVWKVAIELAIRIFKLTAHPEFRGLGDIKNQLERAGVSISNNIAEGFERGTTNELLHFIYIARGSAGEVRSMTHILTALPGMERHNADILDARGCATNIARQLRGWADSLQNSEIKGQRYLTDQVRQEAERQREYADFDAEMQRHADELKARLEAQAEANDQKRQQEES